MDHNEDPPTFCRSCEEWRRAHERTSRRMQQLEQKVAQRTALLRMALILTKSYEDQTEDEDRFAMWAALARYAIGEARPEDGPPNASHPEHRPGLLECLRTIAYHRQAPLIATAPEDSPGRQGYMHALDRVENTIRAELENGGPLTTPLADVAVPRETREGK